MASPYLKSIILAYLARSRFQFWNRLNISNTQWPFRLCSSCKLFSISPQAEGILADPDFICCSVRRLDKLLVVVKTLVGEDLHIDNIHMRGDYGV